MLLIISLLGINKGNRLTCSVKDTDKLIMFFKELKSKIYYTGDSVYEIISKSNNNSLFVKELQKHLNNVDFPDAWNKSKDYVKKLLTDEDCLVLSELGKIIGSTDKENQVQIIDYAIFRFENSLSEKKEKEKNEKKLYYFTGISFGVIAMIIII